MQDFLQNLNEKQREAVLQTEGPVMAIAGAGSGKTSVLTSRIAYLIYEQNVKYMNILAITFTNKAANEMKERVRKTLNIDTRTMWISTFHAMCSRILRVHIERLGYDRNFIILDDDDTTQLVRAIMKQLDIDIKMFSPKVIKNHIFKAKYEIDYLNSLEEPLNEVVSRVFKQYEKRLEENNLVDFEGLLTLTIQLLKENDDVREFYQKQFKYILVDEFQDTNNIQYELVKLLINEDKNIFIVGDEDQSIYAFRGANIENINKFKRDFPNYHLVLLEQNYRSTNNILNAANQIIKNNSNRIHKNLFSTKGDGERITFYKAVTARDEVEYIAMKILALLRKGYTYNDMAVLYRANATSRMFEEVFMQKQIPYRIFGNTSFFKRLEIKDMTAYLRLILNMGDKYSFERAITVPKRGIGQKTIEKVFEYGDLYQLDVFEAIDKSRDFLGKTASDKLIAFKDLIIDFRMKLDELPFNEFIDYVLENSGYIVHLKNDEKGDVRYENLLEFKTILAENNEIYEGYSKEEMLAFMLEDISLKSEESNAEVENGVTFLTLHAAKGLEFKVVFIVTLENGMFPLHRAFQDRFEFEEERRLMYVGVTRAKERLYLTNANMRQTYGETMNNADSAFISEISSDLLEIKGYNEIIERKPAKSFITPSVLTKKREEMIEKRKNSIASYQDNDLNKGDKVSHSVFGDGIVISVTGDECMIAFPHPHGIKKLLKNHKAIQKL